MDVFIYLSARNTSRSRESDVYAATVTNTRYLHFMITKHLHVCIRILHVHSKQNRLLLCVNGPVYMAALVTCYSLLLGNPLGVAPVACCRCSRPPRRVALNVAPSQSSWDKSSVPSSTIPLPEAPMLASSLWTILPLKLYSSAIDVAGIFKLLCSSMLSPLSRPRMLGSGRECLEKLLVCVPLTVACTDSPEPVADDCARIN